MENLKDIEIINISTENGELVATISFQDTNNISDLNNGYDTIRVPVHPRDLQLSSRGNLLVDQSIKSESTVSNNPLINRNNG